MTIKTKFTKSIIAAALAVAITGVTGFAQDALAQAKVKTEPATLNFKNAEIDAVANAMATITGRNVVVDPRVKGTMTLTTEGAVTPAVAYNQFLAVLRLHGYTVVQSAGLDKVVPEADAKLQGGAVSAGAAGVAGNQIVTQIFKLNYEQAANLVQILRPLISPNNTINVNAGNNSLVITDYAENQQRLAKIIATMDVAPNADIEIIPLKHAIATDLAPLVTHLIGSSTVAQTAPAPLGQTAPATVATTRTVLLAEARTNSVILRAANQAQAMLARQLVERLDQPTSANGGSGNIHIVYLKNADATKLAATLRLAMGSDSKQAAPAAATAGAGAAPAVAASSQPTATMVQADAATNSLIITAPEPKYRELREVIDKLDARRAQVFVESLIAEVNEDKAAEFGIQWQGSLGRAGESNIGLLGTNFGTLGSNIINLATQGITSTNAPGRGLNVGVANQNNGVYVLGFLARFLQQTGSGNILSTPNLLTLDNEEAKIVIGKNVPFVTGQYTNNNSANGAVNPFQTIERKDVGLTLRVKPQISENGTVKLEIYQEVSSVDPNTVGSQTGPTTNKRAIESKVLVSDGNVVVLGGLLQDEYSGNQEKVPGVGDIPIFGNLFKSEARGRKKTNLMVFLRPVVVRDDSSTTALSMNRYDMMRNFQSGAQPAPSSVLGINEAPVLPPVAPKTAVAESGSTKSEKQ